MGVAARISEIFLYKASGKCFLLRIQISKKKILTVGGWLGLVIFFLFSKESKSEKIIVFFLKG